MEPNPWLLTMAVFAPVLTGAVTLCLPRPGGWTEVRTWLAALGPATAFVLVLLHLTAYGIPEAAALARTGTIPWMPSLQINLGWIADGLGGFFALLVSGIGTLIVLYARAYFGKAPDDLYRFFPTLGLFTTAMLGIVLSDYTLLTLLFWEMTSISSFLLIGWDRYDKEAVRLAMQAFFTTGMGGMALFGGVTLFGFATSPDALRGNFDLAEAFASGGGIWRWSELYAMTDLQLTTGVKWAFGLMFIGAATKSAQYPFHYWLPGAMAAPTPVSAFLHSATMVKAGVFLLGRLFPVFGLIGVGLGGRKPTPSRRGPRTVSTSGPAC